MSTEHVEVPTDSTHGQNTQTPQTPGSPETNADQSQEQRPDWLPEKFKTPQDMAASYRELEKKQANTTNTSTTETPSVADLKLENASESQESSTSAETSGGVDLAKYTQEFNETGAISDQSYEELAKSGHSKEVVDQYIAGQQALAQQFLNEVYTVTDGADNYQRMSQWAQSSLSDAERESFDQIVSAGDANATRLAVSGLYAQFVAAAGKDPKLLAGNTTPATGGDTFSSSAEVSQAIRDPRYKTNPAYRQSIQDKIQRSDIMR